MARRKGCPENEELPHIHVFFKGDCRTFEGPPFFTQSHPECHIDKARVSDIKRAVKDRCGYEDGTPFQQSIWRGEFDIYWNGNKLDDNLFLESVTSETSEKSVKLEMYSTVNVVLHGPFKAMNDADEAERNARGGKKKTRRIITLRKKGGPKAPNVAVKLNVQQVFATRDKHFTSN